MPGLHRSLFAALLVATSGCAQVGRFSGPVSVFRKSPPSKQAEAEPAPFKAAKDAEKEAEQDSASADGPKPEAAEPSAGEKHAAADPPKPADPATVQAKESADTKAAPTAHDAETLGMIEEELRQVSPEERARLYEEFKSLDGEMVRQLIRINRMVRDLESPRETALASGQPPTQPTNPAVAETSSGSGRVLPLGGTEIPSTLPAGPESAETVPIIRPAGHNVAAATGTGHSVSGPVPVIDAVVMAAASSPADGLPAGTANDEWTEQLRRLISVAEARAERSRAAFLEGGSGAGEPARKAYVEAQVRLRLLYLMAGEQARAMQAIPGLDAADQEFWQQLLWGVANYFDDGATPNRSDRATQTVEQLRIAVTRLQGEANLTLRSVAFCHKITSFGNYEKFERDEYSPGKPVLLYAEVANFKSMPQPADGLYKTQIKSTIEFYRAGDGQPVHKVDFDPTTDLCRSYRQDYYHSYELTIPSNLTLGPHVLKLTVEDLQTGKLATYSVNFTVK